MNLLTQALPKIKVSFDREWDGIIGPIITHHREAYELFKSVWNPETIELYEELKALYLDRANVVMGCRDICRGTTRATLVNTKLLIGIALECNAESIVLGHYVK